MLFSILRRVRRGGPEPSVVKAALLGLKAAGVPSYRQSLPRLTAELRRARRFERPLSVVVVAPERVNTLTGNEGKQGAAILQLPLSSLYSHLAFLFLGPFLCDVLRESDIVTYAAEDHVYAIFLPESDGPMVRQAVERLGKAFYDRLSVHLQAGVAEFPKDGFTVEDLFDHARGAWNHQRLMGPFALGSKEVSNAS